MEDNILYQTPHYLSLDPLTGFDIDLLRRDGTTVAYIQAAQLYKSNEFRIERGVFTSGNCKANLAEVTSILIRDIESSLLLEDIHISSAEASENLTIKGRTIITQIKGSFNKLTKIGHENI